MLSLLANAQNIIGVLRKFGVLLLKYWKDVVVVLMLCTIIYQNTQHTRWVFFVDTIPYYQDQYQTAQDALDVAVAANKNLITAIETTNKQVQEWKAVSVGLERANAALSGELVGLRQTTLNQVQDILSGPTPVGCKAAITYLRNSIPELTIDSSESVSP